MKQSEKEQYEMLMRVREFGTAQPGLFPEGTMEGEAFAAVGRAIQQIEAETRTRLVMAEEGRRAKAHARSRLKAHMQAIRRTARRLLRLHPDMRDTFQMGHVRTDVALIASAGVFIREGAALKDRFVEHRLPADTFDVLQQRLDAFAAASQERRVGRKAQAAARDALKAALAAGLEAARTLDVVAGNVLAGDPGLLASWKRERRVAATRRGAPTVFPEPLPSAVPVASTPDAPTPQGPAPAPTAPVAEDVLSKVS